jgi:hypothetical protein
MNSSNTDLDIPVFTTTNVKLNISASIASEYMNDNKCKNIASAKLKLKNQIKRLRALDQK